MNSNPKPAPEELELIAYSLTPKPVMPIVPAPVARDWMSATEHRYAYRCLPMVLANYAGWFILNSHAFRAHWDGTDGKNGVTILYMEGDEPFPATSMFGHGIVTFTIPYLFRTSGGYDLLARGPANLPKDGISPLEGLIEADWATATFTMNWKLTRQDHVVSFDRDEPVCMIVPQEARRSGIVSTCPCRYRFATAACRSAPFLGTEPLSVPQRNAHVRH